MRRPTSATGGGRRRAPDRRADGDAPGVPARRAALRMLDGVLRQGLPLEQVATRALAAVPSQADRALAHAIAGEVLRRLPDLDALIDGATARMPLPHDAKARAVLRIALVQALVLGTPPHAAIATALPLLEGGPRRLAHGVFSAVTNAAPTLPSPPTFPPAVAERWTSAWGEEVVESARIGLSAPPAVDLTLREPGDTAAWAERLGGTSFAPGHLRLPRGSAVTALEGYREGAWWVQDIAASVPARLLGAGEGKRVLDLCAAPGGKTLQLAAAGWQVTAVDGSESRLARLRENLKRTALAAEIVQADVRAWSPEGAADAILLDAPCSATGIFRRHPDVLHRADTADIARLAQQQLMLLRRAAGWLKPGGSLVYAVCSLEPAEGEEVTLRALSDGVLVADPVAEAVIGFAPDGHGFVRILPGALGAQGGADGFFVARFRRPS